MSIYIVIFSLFLSIMVHASEENTKKIRWWKRILCCAWQASASEPDYSSNSTQQPVEVQTLAADPQQISAQEALDLKAHEKYLKQLEDARNRRLETLGELARDAESLSMQPTYYYKLAQEQEDDYKKIGKLTLAIYRAVESKKPDSEGAWKSVNEGIRLCTKLLRQLREDLDDCQAEAEKKREIDQVIDQITERKSLFTDHAAQLRNIFKELQERQLSEGDS